MHPVRERPVRRECRCEGRKPEHLLEPAGLCDSAMIAACPRNVAHIGRKALGDQKKAESLAAEEHEQPMKNLSAPVIGLVLTLFLPAHAEQAPEIEDFTFKRVGLPSQGKPRITVQIDPDEQARRLKVRPPNAPPVAASPSPAADGAAVGSFGWFWETVPVNGVGPGGLNKALAVLRNSPVGMQGTIYRLGALQAIADRYGATLLAESVGTKVSPALALAVVAVESAGRAGAVSGAGAEGLMQLMPATAQRFGVTDSSDPRQNIRGGISYLDWLMSRFGGDPILALAGYNAGEGAVERHGGVPPYAETRDYVPKVLAAFAVARGLCATPPVLVSDGCVFVGERMASSD